MLYTSAKIFKQGAVSHKRPKSFNKSVQPLPNIQSNLLYTSCWDIHCEHQIHLTVFEADMRQVIQIQNTQIMQQEGGEL